MTTTTIRDVDRGDVVTATVTFKNEAGVIADPTTVTFYVQSPGTETAYVYSTDPGSAVTKVSTGVYRLDLPITVDHDYLIRAVGTGTVAAAVPGRIVVTRDKFTL